MLPNRCRTCGEIFCTCKRSAPVDDIQVSDMNPVVFGVLSLLLAFCAFVLGTIYGSIFRPWH